MHRTYVIQLDTSEGVQEMELTRVFVQTDDTQSAILTMEHFGTVQEETTEEALLQLAKALPEGWRLRCCLSCCHGNFCPVGDEDNEIFCGKGLELQCKEDIFRITEDSAERETRRRTLMHCCPEFKPASAEHYTYNDYLSRLNS